MVAQSVASLTAFIKKFSEHSAWKKDGTAIIKFAPQSITECAIGKFSMQAEHTKTPIVVKDTLTFWRCSERIGSLVLEREGPDTQPLSDADLLAVKLPDPSKSTKYRLRISFYSIDMSVINKSGASRSEISFAIPQPYTFLHTRIDEVSSAPNTAMRRYWIEAVSSQGRETADFTERRIQGSGPAPSYFYGYSSPSQSSASISSGDFLTIYQGSVEGSIVGTLRSLFQLLPSPFPTILATASGQN